MISRRTLLQTVPLAAAFHGLCRATKLNDIGVQLYTVRTILPNKMEETLRAIEAAGYTEIEATWAGLDKLIAALKSTRLKPVSIHLDSKIISSAPADEL